MGLASAGCAGFINDPNADAALTAFFKAQGSRCQMNLEQDADQLPHVYSACACALLKNVSSQGYQFYEYVFSQSNGPVFTADYPTSSPYVTSVGATMFVGTQQSFTEVACTIQRGALITTGGGFSSFQQQPSYQAKAVANYIAQGQSNSDFPPSWAFNAQMRGYPDVAFNGHNYLIFVSKSGKSDSCPCVPAQVDGTSASSPSFAGLVSLINDHLLNNNKSPLGFLNPLLYSAPSNCFTDIQQGDNRCNRGYCCIYGFPSASQWDPVSGLGSPKFANLLTYVNSIKGLKHI